ncbi:hypothetical protein ACQGAO_31005 [Rhodococcus sp. 1.20]|jgi:alpha-aminoadipate carrier protein LysW|uniref:hypothetical protein n=1 Tax=Nocardiaceae TaxID=85025 RepID=UPI001BEA8F53|nr:MULTISPECIES: hypothetical protein [Rhodococcus]MBT2263411.1 hypothetical protein [Rhodococcus erythropolis]MBT2275079.1 hypothetical protein [Rhodococcus qingshengii]MCD2104425.1 hypothetical protein [Rhodococcus qingshengii]MCZ4523479.1 hypothetical protein [Rhodococcus erythropolis]
MSLLNTECPECETDFATPPLDAGETMSCPECLLTLRVSTVVGGAPQFEMVQTQLRDWGE